MTLANSVKDNPKYVTVLDHGFVGLVDHMGSDSAIVQAARVSYGDGTKSVREDRALIRYLVRHKHTSPLEMCVVKLHLKLPIFVMRQLVRHRTSSLNEYSGRYSVMTDEFYVPELNQIKPQSDDNKQGRSGELTQSHAELVQHAMREHNTAAYKTYEQLLGVMDQDTAHVWDEFPGVAREIARTVLPVSNYTELYWKQDIHNLFHMLRLRIDPHAQWEIQVFAQAIYDLVKPLYPAACEAFEDYIKGSKNLSRMDVTLLQDLVAESNLFTGIDDEYMSPRELLMFWIEQAGSPKKFAESRNMSERELKEFKAAWNL